MGHTSLKFIQFFFLFLERASLCSPGSPRTCFIYEANLCLLSTGFKGMHHHHWCNHFSKLNLKTFNPANMESHKSVWSQPGSFSTSIKWGQATSCVWGLRTRWKTQMTTIGFNSYNQRGEHLCGLNGLWLRSWNSFLCSLACGAYLPRSYAPFIQT